MSKKCTSCGRVLPESEFYRDEQRKDGTWRYKTKCKSCVSAYNNKYVKAHYDPVRRREKYLQNKKRAEEYYQRNKEKLKKQTTMRVRNQRAFEKGASETLTLSDWEKVLEKFDNRCAYCGGEGFPLGLGADHLIPLNHGGKNTPDNVVPCCRSCNSRKHTMPFFVWYPQQKFFDPDKLAKIVQHRMEGV